MIKKIYIRNFLSIKNAEVNLGKVNLLIGANNSGKSNFLKAFDFLKEKEHLTSEKLLRHVFNHKINDKISEKILEVSIQNNKKEKFCKQVIKNENNILETKTKDDSWDFEIGVLELTFFEKIINKIIIYVVNTEKIKNYCNLNASDKIVNSDASNLVSFLDNMRDEYPNVIRNIEKSLQNTVSNFRELRFKKDKNNANAKMLGLSDKNNNIFWANELSEGTLYFLSILAIIHQPNPPKLLLLEEPEKNVHPKRIHEIIDYLFQLSEDKDIQIIMTTHSPIVVDEFKDIPENVHLFDFIDNQTKISNMADIIKEQNKNRKEKGYSLLNFTDTTLAEHWLMGFLGGVPTE